VFGGNLEFMSGSQRSGASRLGAFFSFIGLSTVAGFVLAIVISPLALLSGLMASAGITAFDSLPSYIKPVNTSQASTIWATKDGQPVAVAKFFEENRISVPFESMSPNIVNAVISTEDPRFYQHNGVDVLSFLRASIGQVLRTGSSGGSTITMQYVKNTLVEAAVLAGDKEAAAAATATSPDRKIKEIRLAIALEKTTSKKDILAGYLNIAYFGNQIYGIEAASNYYFGVHASELSISQAALLGGMVQNPENFRPDIAANLPAAKGRRDYVINNMLKHSDITHITQEEAQAAIAEPITVHLTHSKSGCEIEQTTAFFCDYAVWAIRNNPEFGQTPADREALLRRGGLDIYTTMDIAVQTAADKATKYWVPPTDKSKIGSATVSVQVGTGRILAIAQNRIFDQTANPPAGHTAVNYAADVNYGGSHGFQTGSTYKLFTLAEWLKKGYKLNDKVDGRIKEWNATDFASRCGALTGTWKPNNIVKEPDNPSVVEATAKSENTAFASMASKLDLCDIRDTAMAFGVHRADLTPLVSYPASILGINEIAPVTMAAAVAGIANKGIFCTPIAIDKVVVRATNEEMPVPTTQCTEAVSPEVAAGMIYAMRAVMSGGTGGASNTGDGAQIAGKTGTTDSGVHTWMTGTTTAVGTATWVGNVVGSTTLGKVLLRNKPANTVRHDIWRTTMQTVNKIYKPGKFENPPKDMVDATMITVPNEAGKLPSEAASDLVLNNLNAKIVVQQVNSSQPVGTVAGTQPRPGKAVALGTLVKIYVSKGGSSIVPDVSNMTVGDAKNTLLAAGFAAVSVPQASQTQYYQHSATVPAGNVIATLPAAGTTASSDGAILLIISAGP
jgi:membrane peptidoglycan carboxypeptidase